ncbi:hypothetical protein [Thiothrix subterranea]|uniref:Uncharacterized protein n=1 Tax=Thiothrix subterranea TaxID=2735563 RepID=A0AA51MT85_9GAMM|nr:hypothetical protein [Thiothrix subterranea]MDQ5770174.1 hypothetical protein [Thiothrix subterranea]WML88916.1 hypothetical protein RCG00_11175 [Thiothrix subterranea]
MDIAPSFSVEEWKKLDLENNEDDWQKAVSVFKDRIYARYIDPVDLLVDAEKDVDPKNKRFGFTTLAIDLLLMETLQAFKEGLPDTSGMSAQVFKRFLEQSSRFSEYFKTEPERREFYTQFRCGILHQAEVQSSALVWSVGDLYDRTSFPHTVNRMFIHRALKDDLDDYLKLLRDPMSKKARTEFKKKMDAIADREAFV